jgi:hypothetical protein
MLEREITAVCSQIHTKHIKTQSVPRSKLTVSVIKTSQLMLYREIIAVCSQIHTKHINTLCGQNAVFVYVKPVGTCSNHCAVQGWYGSCFLVRVFSCSSVSLPFDYRLHQSCVLPAALRTPPAIPNTLSSTRQGPVSVSASLDVALLCGYRRKAERLSFVLNMLTAIQWSSAVFLNLCETAAR